MITQSHIVHETPVLYAFNGATKQLGIAHDRMRFWDWRRFVGAEIGELHTLDDWEWLYDRFVEWEDARAEAETQADALM